jgi:hypothetical protein
MMGCALMALQKDQLVINHKEKEVWKTSEMMGGFCFVISTSGLNGPNTG